MPLSVTIHTKREGPVPLIKNKALKLCLLIMIIFMSIKIEG